MPDSWVEGDLGLRLHRARSWIERARREEADADAAFIFAWIAFNAAYAERRSTIDDLSGERTRFRRYFEQILDLDSRRAIYDAIWQEFSGPVRIILANRYVYEPFWNHFNGVDGFADWERRFERDRNLVYRALGERDTGFILDHLFRRLYVLRNQLMHGGATWNGSVNRRQVEDGARIMAFLVPLFVDLMEANPSIDWGSPPYPVVD